jgi:enamine deaminase RidA (YjgF/YER057c/UK114 family)
MKSIYIENIAKPAGHYSPGVVHNGLVYVSGQLPVEYAVKAMKLLGLLLEGRLN